MLTEVNLHLRNYTEGLTARLLNFRAMKVIIKQSLYDKNSIGASNKFQAILDINYLELC